MRRVVILCSALCTISACKETAIAPSAPPPTKVTTETVVARALPTYISLPGTTTSVQEVNVQARVEGWLMQRHFQEGQTVAEGELLYEIDSAPYDAQLLQAESALTSAKVQKSYAQTEFERNEPLVLTGAISKQDFDKLETQFEQALAQVVQAEAGVTLAMLNVGYCSIHAPISGKIGKSTVDVGSLVGPGQQATLANIVQVSPMYVEIHPPANRLILIQSLMEGGSLPMHISITENDSESQASASGSVLTKHTATGSLVFVDNTIKSSTSTFLARGEFVNDLGVLPGQYVDVRVQLQVINKAIMVPRKAIMQQPGSYYVWTISDEGTAVVTPVTIGSMQGDYQHILTGLKEGAGVLVEGTTNLRSGTEVTISETSEEAE
ncbi:MAG: efflux RND transporter periplasmic adaptor subunit [Planctomycetes bacterium]|nr:efflux RND transporter periplasmic adaptor subunit [Planctomycetota bacterium]